MSAIVLTPEFQKIRSGLFVITNSGRNPALVEMDYKGELDWHTMPPFSSGEVLISKPCRMRQGNGKTVTMERKRAKQ